MMDLMNENTLYKLVDQLSIDFFGKPFMHIVRFNHRLRSTGGRYLPMQKVIELNPKYVVEMDEQEFIGIIKHELIQSMIWVFVVLIISAVKSKGLDLIYFGFNFIFGLNIF